jgi:hypothetical protein
MVIKLMIFKVFMAFLLCYLNKNFLLAPLKLLAYSVSGYFPSSVTGRCSPVSIPYWMQCNAWAKIYFLSLAAFGRVFFAQAAFCI